MEPFKLELNSYIASKCLTPDQIYSADESGLFWRRIPDKTFVASDEKQAPGRKTAKERVTILVCANFSEIHKLKSKSPRALKDYSEMTLKYTHSKTAWMIKVCFHKWFHESIVKEVSFSAIFLHFYL